MELSHYERFLECEERGLKQAATQAVNAFIESFADADEIESWVWENLPALKFNRHGRVRHELFERLIFPVLKRGIDRGDTAAMLWLGRLIQNLYQARALHAETDWMTDQRLFRMAFETDPASDEARTLLLDAQVNWLAFCAHEWPDMLLCGNAAASREDCREFRSELAFLRGLDREGRYSGFFNDFEEMLHEYEARTGLPTETEPKP